MTNEQIKWASGHDWYIRVLSSGKVLVKSIDGVGVVEYLTFDNFKKLCHWAGY